CEQPLDPGKCKKHMQHYYYDQKTGTCETFIYRGCGGNNNNFATKGDCEAFCTPEVVACLQQPVHVMFACRAITKTRRQKLARNSSMVVVKEMETILLLRNSVNFGSKFRFRLMPHTHERTFRQTRSGGPDSVRQSDHSGRTSPCMNPSDFGVIVCVQLRSFENLADVRCKVRRKDCRT
ncbi:hypothetical protein AB205_0123190, partial [Aquarana catesbeiana]